MQSKYFYVYNNFEIVPENLEERILEKFQNLDLNKEMTYQEILVYLDEKCLSYPKYHRSIEGQYQQQHYNNQYNNRNIYDPYTNKRALERANRNVSRQIFEHCKNKTNEKTRLKDFIEKYVEFLQTAKLCLVREQAKQQILENRLYQAQKHVRNKTFVFIKLIQATIHTRYGTSPCFQYKIHPSDIPKVTVVNSLNPILNHEYVLEMQKSAFSIVFYESGVEIYTWRFDMRLFDENQDGQYFQSKSVEALTFEVHVKLLPKNTSEEKTMLIKQLKNVEQKLNISKKAFSNLCFYVPFLDQPYEQFQEQKYQENPFKRFTNSLFLLLPFMRRHVRALHYILIVLLFVQCLASISWAVQFIDIIIVLALIGVLYDRSRLNVSMNLLVGMFALFLSTIKTIWGAVLKPFDVQKYQLLLFIAIIMKLISLFFIWICTIRADQISQQRIRDIYGMKIAEEDELKSQRYYIFKPNENFYKNKQIYTKQNWHLIRKERKKQEYYRIKQQKNLQKLQKAKNEKKTKNQQQ